MRDFSVRWQNFHGFVDTKAIRIAPITILLGANNSGKSSLFLPLLVLKQSLASRQAEPSLLTRGDLANAGGFRDLAHEGDPAATISFELAFDRSPPLDEVDDCGSPFHYPPAKVRVGFVRNERTEEAQLSEFRIFNAIGKPMLARRLNNSGRYSITGMSFGSEEPRSEFDRLLRHAFKTDQPRSFLFNSFVASSVAARQRRHPEGGGREVSASVDNYMSATDFLYWDLLDLFQNTKYLGPLREPPHRVYQLAGTRPDSVGIRGERAPEILFHNTDKLFDRNVDQWLTTFGFPEKLSTEDLGEGSFAVYLTPPDTDHRINFADMGFGLSQVLPLVVESLLCQDGELLISEQPEIHLNPKLQAELADLFADLVARQGRIIVETHSEHFILRLRRLVAEERLQAKDVGLYFVERAGDTSSVREVPIENNGHISAEAWPKGFFGETLQESMALALAQAERSK